jgi:hypothetical protein
MIEPPVPSAVFFPSNAEIHMAEDKRSIKNPEHEAENPAPSPDYIRDKKHKGGPNTQTDERGRQYQNPEGQQGAAMDPARRA